MEMLELGGERERESLHRDDTNYTRPTEPDPAETEQRQIESICALPHRLQNSSILRGDVGRGALLRLLLLSRRIAPSVEDGSVVM